MSYRWSAGKVDSGDINFSEDLDDHTKIDFEIDQIKLVANNVEYLTVTTGSNNVTVGGNLKVEGDDPRIKIDGVTDSHPGLEFYENGTRKWVIFNNYGDDSLDFKTNSNTRMVINQNGTVGIGTQSPSTTLDVDGTTKSNFYTTTVTTQDLGNGTSSTLSTTSGIVLLDADSITGNDMGGGMEVHSLIFPTPSVSGQKLTIIAQNANTNSTFILPSGLISGSYQSLHDASGLSAVTFVQIVEGNHKAWYQV